MKGTPTKRLLAISLLAAALTLWACDDGPASPAPGVAGDAGADATDDTPSTADVPADPDVVIGPDTLPPVPDVPIAVDVPAVEDSDEDGTNKPDIPVGETADGGSTPGDATTETADATTDGADGAETTAGDDASETEVINPLAIDCNVSFEPVFPDYDDSCTEDTDCALAFHTINCCGTDIVYGINAAQLAAFEAAEATCDSQYPGCGCASFATEAQDGSTGWEQAGFAVKCNEGACWSYTPK